MIRNENVTILSILLVMTFHFNLKFAIKIIAVITHIIQYYLDQTIINKCNCFQDL